MLQKGQAPIANGYKYSVRTGHQVFLLVMKGNFYYLTPLSGPGLLEGGAIRKGCEALRIRFYCFGYESFPKKRSRDN